MNIKNLLNKKRISRKKRTRAKISGSSERPRLSIFRSTRFLYAQLIDDTRHKTLASATTRSLSAVEKKKKKTEQAKILGVAIAKKAAELGIKKIIIDRGSYRYHGRVKALTDGIRSEGLNI